MEAAADIPLALGEKKKKKEAVALAQRVPLIHQGGRALRPFTFRVVDVRSKLTLLAQEADKNTSYLQMNLSQADQPGAGREVRYLVLRE